ncbi:hypothetical protein EDD86DRAFT_262847 [Gorgonomyces haynaldii]|nr:hypothetical protein EDD86DRAFT_262847 [Gorgonomyces haynaldii]
MSESRRDVIEQQLDPTDDFKASLLSGMSPELIGDILTRGLSFYQHQITNELELLHDIVKDQEQEYHCLVGKFEKHKHQSELDMNDLETKIHGIWIDPRALCQSE